MLPVVGNAMSLWDVGTDIHGICSGRNGGAKNPFNWGILTIDAIGVVPAAGNASRPARAVVKEVLLAFAKGSAAAVLVDIFWATAGGNVVAFMSELDKHLQSWKDDIIAGVRQASRTVRQFVASPVSAAHQMGVLKEKKGFLSWVPSTEEIALHGIDELLEISGQRATILAWLDEFDRNAPSMIAAAIGDVAKAGTLLFMARQIVDEIRRRRGPALLSAPSSHAIGATHTKGHAQAATASKDGAGAHHEPPPSHTTQVAPGALAAPHAKSGEHRDTTQKPQKGSNTPAKDGCGCPSTGSGKSVNYAMGDENLTQVDFALDGVVPIVWARRYRSSLAAYDASPLGARWSSPFHLSILEDDGKLVFFDPDNRAVTLPPVAIGDAVMVEREQLTVSRPDARSVILRYLDGSREEYQLHARRYVLASRTGRDGLGLTLAYNQQGDLTGISDGHGLAIRLDYTDGRVATITRVSPTNEPIDVLARYDYSREGNLIAHTDVLGHRRTFDYTQHLLTRYTDFNGYATHLEWDWPGRSTGTPAPADARVIREWRGSGNDNPRAIDIQQDTRFEYHREHWYTKVTDADGHSTIHRYDHHNQIVMVEHPTGIVETYLWDARGNLSRVKNAAGQTQQFDYDDAGRLIATTDAMGNVTHTEYNAHGLPVKITNAAGDVTLTDYDALGRPTSVTDPAGRVTQYTWSGSGQLLALTDPKGGTRQFAYDGGARLTQATDCSGHATRYTYDERGYLLRRTDAEGHATAFRHDARGQLTQITRPDGTQESFAYDGEGNLIAYTDGAGQVTRYQYNGNHQPCLRTDAAGRTLAYRYDRQWRLTQLYNESHQATTFRYDALGQLTEESGFDGQTTYYAYDAAGQLGASRAGDISTEYTRNPLGQLTQRDTRGPSGTVSQRFYYDQRARLTTAQTEGSTVRFHYDDAGNLIAEEQHVHLDYAANYVTVTRHEYDALGNRTRTVLPNTRTVDWLRYGSGHVHGVLLDGRPLLDFARDKLHRETGRTHPAFSQRRGYDPAGRLARFTVKSAGPSTPHELIAERCLQYSAAGHLTRIDDRTRGVTEYGYDAVGRLLKAASPDLTEMFAFDPAGNPVDPEKVPAPPELESAEERTARFAREAAEDAAWLRAHPGETHPPRRYDRRAWEDSQKRRDYEQSLPKWLDNLMREHLGTRYDYDEYGNLTRRIDWNGPTWLYQYDALNRLKEVRRFTKTPQPNEPDHTEHADRFTHSASVAPELTVKFSYDAFGRRTLKEVRHPNESIDRTVFTWDGDVLLMEERFHAPPGRGLYQQPEYQRIELIRDDPADPYSVPVVQRQHTSKDQWQAVSLYLHEPGTFVPLAKLDEILVEAAYFKTGTDGRFVEYPPTTRHATYFYQNDHLGTPQELVDESGKVVWLAKYRAWGGLKGGRQARASVNSSLDAAGNAIRAPGQYEDAETGLHYNRHRYYDPQTGRFISKDPIGLAGGVNVYAYAENPVLWTDPLGLAAKLQCPLCCDGSHGRSNKQERLKALADDPKQPRWVRGWVKNELRHIETGNRKSVRLPGNSRNSRTPGLELAHGRETEAKDGYCYRHSELQDAVLHKTQHQIGGY
jgi:RHS repeat-associated protein